MWQEYKTPQKLESVDSRQLLAIVEARNIVMDEERWNPAEDEPGHSSYTLLGSPDSRIDAHDIYNALVEMVGCHGKSGVASSTNADKTTFTVSSQALEWTRNTISSACDVGSIESGYAKNFR